MKIDLRLEKDFATTPLVALDATSQGLLLDYCKKRSIKISDIEEIYFGESQMSLPSKIGWATMIAKNFDVIVHFSHLETPITAYPNTAMAARLDYERRRASGEKIENLKPDSCAICGRTAAWHDRHRPAHSFSNEGE